MYQTIKLATTYDQQIDLLEKRGLLITDRVKAKDVLSRLNYYTFTGYLHDFKVDGDKYIESLSFEKVYNIIEFDRRFRNVLVYAIETVEQTIKTKIAYNFAHSIGATEYLNSTIFKDKKEHDIFMKHLRKNIQNNRNLPFVKHHIKAYGGVLPVWVAVEIFTLGMIYNFCKNLPTKNQKEIARGYNTGPVQLLSWLENVKYIRNMIAHYMRLYNFKLQKTPMKCWKNHAFKETTYKIFDIIYVIKFLILDDGEWNNYILSNLGALFSQYDEYINKQCLGFPENWESILRK